MKKLPIIALSLLGAATLLAHSGESAETLRAIALQSP